AGDVADAGDGQDGALQAISGDVGLDRSFGGDDGSCRSLARRPGHVHGIAVLANAHRLVVAVPTGEPRVPWSCAWGVASNLDTDDQAIDAVEGNKHPGHLDEALDMTMNGPHESRNLASEILSHGLRHCGGNAGSGRGIIGKGGVPMTGDLLV